MPLAGPSVTPKGFAGTEARESNHAYRPNRRSDDVDPNQQDIMMFRDGDEILCLAPFILELDDLEDSDGNIA